MKGVLQPLYDVDVHMAANANQAVGILLEIWATTRQ